MASVPAVESTYQPGLGVLGRSLWWVLGVPLVLSGAAFVGFSQGFSEVDRTVVGYGAALLLASLTFFLATTIVPWYLSSGGIIVTVSDTQLRVERRGRTLFETSLSGILQVAVYGVTSWGNLNPQQAVSGGRFPRLKVFTRSGEWTSPGLLLWQGESREFEDWLQGRIAKHKFGHADE